MKTRVQKWGNSLAVRIPRTFANEVGLASDSPVDLSLPNRKVIVEPTQQPPLILKQLLKGVTKDNLHRETDTGSPRGGEVW